MAAVDDLRPGPDDPPVFIRAMAHSVRWQVVRVLSQSDRTVGELTQLVGEPQNLVSYHLRLLRDAGLVTARQSSADRRDRYYALDVGACRRELQVAGEALHPVLGGPAPRSGRARRQPRVLFLCTGNSARSQVAEALLAQASAGRVEAASAGSHPKPLHPDAVRVLQSRGIDISGNRTKHVDELVSRRLDLVVTLCDRVREVCPEFPSRPRLVHWSTPDPAAVAAGPRDRYRAFERMAAELEARIDFLLPTLAA